MPNYRLIVTFDLQNQPDLMHAYAKLARTLRKFSDPWETSDEWYDENGDLGEPSILQESIAASFELPKEDR